MSRRPTSSDAEAEAVIARIAAALRSRAEAESAVIIDAGLDELRPGLDEATAAAAELDGAFARALDERLAGKSDDGELKRLWASLVAARAHCDREWQSMVWASLKVLG